MARVVAISREQPRRPTDGAEGSHGKTSAEPERLFAVLDIELPSWRESDPILGNQDSN